LNWWDAIEFLLDITQENGKNLKESGNLKVKVLNLDFSDFEKENNKSRNKIESASKNNEDKDKSDILEVISCNCKEKNQVAPDNDRNDENESDQNKPGQNKVAPDNDHNDENESDRNKPEHILKLILKTKKINNEKHDLFIKHPATKFLLHKKWPLYLRVSFPKFCYYFNLIIFSIFLIFYSINIEIYSRKGDYTDLDMKCKIICFSTLAYLIVIELFLMISSIFLATDLKSLFISIIKNIVFSVISNIPLATDGQSLFISLIKNIVVIFSFCSCMAALIIEFRFKDLKSDWIHAISPLYSLTILGAYFIFASRLDKVPYVGIYIDVIWKILKKSLKFLLILIMALIAFILAFRNRSKFYEINGQGANQMSYFNTSFVNNLFQLTKFSLGNLETDNMGIDHGNETNFVNYLIYGCFIFIMPIMFLNIFQSISIGEVKQLFEESEINDLRTKIKYVLLFEKFKNLRFSKWFLSILDKIIEKFKNLRFSKWFLSKLDNFLLKIESCNSEKKTNSSVEKPNSSVEKPVSLEKRILDKMENIEMKFEKLESVMEAMNKIFFEEVKRNEEKRNNEKIDSVSPTRD
jgi:hypothetical protein